MPWLHLRSTIFKIHNINLWNGWCYSRKNDLGKKASQKCIRSNIEWNAKTQICRSLVHLARQFPIGYIKLHERSQCIIPFSSLCFWKDHASQKGWPPMVRCHLSQMWTSSKDTSKIWKIYYTTDELKRSPYLRQQEFSLQEQFWQIWIVVILLGGRLQ